MNPRAEQQRQTAALPTAEVMPDGRIHLVTGAWEDTLTRKSAENWRVWYLDRASDGSTHALAIAEALRVALAKNAPQGDEAPRTGADTRKTDMAPQRPATGLPEGIATATEEFE